MGPFYWRDVPADQREWLLSLLRIEGKVAAAYADLGPDDILDPHYFDDDD